ncbi:MAG: hypothetical protein IH585_03885 [Anaerolineaceae bacterium]|nr:hypothetical protein [Anaerolineaceae bacterium]
MNNGNEILMSTLLSSTTLLVIVGKIVSTIELFKKSKRYNKHARRLMIVLLVISLGFSLYLLYMAFAFGNPHPSASPVLLY